MKDSDFIYIPGWAVNQLRLKGNELMIYSIIFSYSRDGIQWYQAPAEYLASCVGASVSTVKDILKKLSDKGLLNKKSEKYKGSVDRVYYQAIVPEHDQCENGTGQPDLPVPKRYGCTSTETVHNNTTNDTSIKKPSTPPRRSLINLSTDTKKKSKIDKFVQDKLRIAQEYEFSECVEVHLSEFFQMLAESGTNLPDITIRAQLDDLVNLSETQKIKAITDTIKSGWKSLKYAVESVKKSETPSFDTAKPGAFQPKDPKNDSRCQQYQDDEVF